MDEKIEKAFEVANYMATLSNQRRIILEEFNYALIYYINGATFKINPELINFTKTMIELGNTNNVFLDSNNLPVIIPNIIDFYNNITTIYFKSLSEYHTKYTEISKKRKIMDIVEL